MTDDQINHRIAEACGWTEKPRRMPDGLWYYGRCPNYCNDLNAMAEAEGTLSLDRLYKLEAHLKQIAGAVCFRATARQRAEAFLRTLGKWEEVQK